MSYTVGAANEDNQTRDGEPRTGAQHPCSHQPPAHHQQKPEKFINNLKPITSPLYICYIGMTSAFYWSSLIFTMSYLNEKYPAGFQSSQYRKPILMCTVNRPEVVYQLMDFDIVRK